MMVSPKILAATALLLVFTSGVYSTLPALTPVCGCYDTYYNNFGLKLDVVLGGLGDLLGGILGSVGVILNNALGFVGGLLGGLLGGNHGKVTTVVDFFGGNNGVQSQADALNLAIKLCIVGAPIYDKVHPGLSKYYSQSCVANVVIGVSLKQRNWDGLCFKPLPINRKSEWLDILKVKLLIADWIKFRASINLSSLPDSKRVVFEYIDSLIVNLDVNVIGSKWNSGLLDSILQSVFGLVGHLTVLVGGLLDDILGLCGSYYFSNYGNQNSILSVDLNLFNEAIRAKVGLFGKSHYKECFSY